MIGTFANVAFEVSSYKVLTFNNFKTDYAAKFAEHETISQPSKLEFLHRELRKVSFDIILHSSLGVNPREELAKIQELCENGAADFLILGNQVFQDCQWIIEDFSESVEIFGKNAEVVASKVTLKFKEYN